MGLSVRNMLCNEYFKDYKIIAGKKGLDREIQGIAVLDAPDGVNWTIGKELIISSGYVFKINPSLFQEFIDSNALKRSSGLAFKMRHIDHFPDYFIDYCEKNDIPLLTIPAEHSWMGMMNQLNVIVMNNNIRRFNIGRINPRNFSDISYQSKKINKILSQIEKELNFPAMLYDVSSERLFLSSKNVLKLAEGLEIENLWHTKPGVEQQVLCDNLKMIRYRYRNKDLEIPYSWIKVPVTVEGEIKAYFVVVEATGLIDYFDEISLRIGFLLIHSLFEQLLAAQIIGDAGFEKLVNDIINGYISEPYAITKKADEIGLDLAKEYYIVEMEQKTPVLNLHDFRDEIRNIMGTNFDLNDGRIAVVDENSCLILFCADSMLSEEKELARHRERCMELKKRLEKKYSKLSLIFGESDVKCSLHDVGRSYRRAKKALQNGRLLYPESEYFYYTGIGIFGWLDIREDELDLMMNGAQELFKNPDNQELLDILEAYLECNMNYSLTAKKKFLHINTIRKKVDQVSRLTNVDLDDPISRLKLELLIKLMKVRH